MEYTAMSVDLVRFYRMSQLVPDEKSRSSILGSQVNKLFNLFKR